MPLPNYKIGDTITFTKAYRRKCSHRFADFKQATPTPYLSGGTAFVVGLRCVIMTDFEMPLLKDSYGDFLGYGPACGKREWCLLVTTNIRRNPFLVRLCDLCNA